jgi:hypothetical protein
MNVWNPPPTSGLLHELQKRIDTLDLIVIDLLTLNPALVSNDIIVELLHKLSVYEKWNQKYRRATPATPRDETSAV